MLSHKNGSLNQAGNLAIRVSRSQKWFRFALPWFAFANSKPVSQKRLYVLVKAISCMFLIIAI
jgi:hypothetical protein